MSKPVIGVCASSAEAAWDSWIDTPAVLLPEAYAAGIVEAQGVPVILFPGSDPNAIVDRLDGIVLVGGPDVDAAAYGAEPGPWAQPADRRRDAFEACLVARATQRDLPLLAICRGLQVLNVARGGTLHQHLPDVVGHSRHSPGPGVYGQTKIHIDPLSRPAGMLGEASRTVECYHHQGIDRLGNHLVVVARAGDGVIEAIEDRTLRFMVGVQWHPEVRGDPALFRSFVDACSTSREP